MLLGKLFYATYMGTLGSNEPDMCQPVNKIIAFGNRKRKMNDFMQKYILSRKCMNEIGKQLLL